jgi:hypothetical protein
MKKTRPTNEQVAYVLRQVETGTPVGGIRKVGVEEIRRMKQLERREPEAEAVDADLEFRKADAAACVLKKTLRADRSVWLCSAATIGKTEAGHNPSVRLPRTALPGLVPVPADNQTLEFYGTCPAPSRLSPGWPSRSTSCPPPWKTTPTGPHSPKILRILSVPVFEKTSI